MVEDRVSTIGASEVTMIFRSTRDREVDRQAIDEPALRRRSRPVIVESRQAGGHGVGVPRHAQEHKLAGRVRHHGPLAI